MSMKFEECGKYVKNLAIEIKPHEYIELNLLKDLHNLLGCIKKTKPEILNEFLEILTRKLKSHLNRDFSVNDTIQFAELIRQYENLIEYEDLTKLSLNFFLQELGITEKQLWENKDKKFPVKNFHTAAIAFYFHQLNSLIDILGKNAAIDFYKDHLLKFIYTFETKQKNIYKSLEELRERQIRFINRGTFGRVRLVSNVENGRLIKICKNCDKTDHLDKTIRQEKDLLYAISCWLHIPLVEMWNENFVLAIEKCLVRGDPYCAYVYQDKRAVRDIVQSSEEYLDEIWSKYKKKNNYW